MTIRSFVLRQGRMTTGQERAFSEYWSTFGIEVSPTLQITSSAIFNDERDLVLEIGFGNGESLIEMAKAAPEKGFIGIEVHRPGVGHALLKTAEAGINNLRFIRHDAAEILRDNVLVETLSRLQIYFPDPWTKKRHHKRRIIQPAFLNQVWHKLRAGGEIHCATDWEEYAYWMRDAFAASDYPWRNLGEENGFSPRPAFRPKTKFEQRGQKLGHGVWDLRYQKLVS